MTVGCNRRSEHGFCGIRSEQDICCISLPKAAAARSQMTGKTKVERRALVRGITAVPAAAALSSTLLPKCAIAQAANPSVSAASDRFEGAEIKVGDNIIFVRRYGNGSPLLMVHGFPRSSLMWRFVAPQLASNHTVICVDLRGYARSGVPDSSEDHCPLYEARNGQ